MSWQRSLQSAVKALKKEEASLLKQLDGVQQKIKELEEVGRTAPTAVTKSPSSRRLSQEGRDAISEAAKKRWAKYRTEKARQNRGAARKKRG